MSSEDAVLLDAARSGDEAALAKLLAENEARIYRFGAKMCRDEEDAKDVLQETLLAVARGIRDFRGASSLSTWLYKIARSNCIKARRKSKFAPTEEQPLKDDVKSAAATPEDQAAGLQLQRALEGAIRALDPKYREVLLLRDVEGLTAAEVGEVLDLSVDAVKSRLHRARLSVRERIAPMLAPPTPACPADILGTFSRYVEGEIDPEHCAEMEQHVASCPRCKDACDSLKETLALCRAAPKGEVPPDVQAAVRSAIKMSAR